MFKGLIHELVHHLYKYYVYGKEKERIVWVDEGLAQFLSKQKDDLQDDFIFEKFLIENVKNSSDINLNELNHNDKSFAVKKLTIIIPCMGNQTQAKKAGNEIHGEKESEYK